MHPNAAWQPKFRHDLVKIGVMLTGKNHGEETFWAEPLGGGLYRVANLLWAAPFTLGDIVRTRKYPWGAVQVVGVVARSPATAFAWWVGGEAYCHPDPRVADALLTVIDALGPALHARGIAVAHQDHGLLNVAWSRHGRRPITVDAGIRELDGALCDLLANDDAAGRAAANLTGLSSVGVVTFSVHRTHHPRMPLGLVPGISPAYVDDPRLPPMCYSTDERDALLQGIDEVLTAYGPPPGFTQAELFEHVERALVWSVDARHMMATRQYTALAEDAFLCIAIERNLPIPHDRLFPEVEA